jgi:DNA topoisomerase-1
MSKLIIVESPTKAKTITRFLKGKYDVIASKGHIRDLPKSSLGVDVKNNFEPEYVVPEKAEESVKQLKKLAKNASEIYLATDEDREGESISYHIAWLLTDGKGKKTEKIKKYKRIVFHEITQEAIEKALASPKHVDLNLVDAQQARRVLDRLVGYKLSPLLWKKIRFGLSAGRVQSVALRLIVEKERERDAFNIEDYFLINANFESSKKTFPAKLNSIDGKKLITKTKDGQKFLLTSEADAKKHVGQILKQDYFIDSVTEREKSRKAYPPFTTSLLQQAASNIAGFTANRTMRAAQKLYEKGLITYHRTDSYNLSKKFRTEAEKFIKKEVGDNYYTENFFKTKSKGAQEAHEAIRPTSLKKLPNAVNLTKDEKIIYDLVFARSLAVFMAPIKSLATSVKIVSKNETYVFNASGQQVLFEGWNKAYSFMDIVKYSPLGEDVVLPELKKQDEAKIKKCDSEHKQTTPPARYTEASLIKTLESYGIGRPSTYAPTIGTIRGRGYIEKEGRTIIPTDLGKIVTKLLEDNFSDVVDYSFTAEIEGDLDAVAEGKKEWEKVIKSFYGPFEKNLNQVEDKIGRKDYTVLGPAPKDIKCPECKGKMDLKLGKIGRFYSCSKFPDCKGIRDISGKTEEDIAKEAQSPEFKKKYKAAPKTDDGREYLLKKGRYGEFWAHPDYPKVKDARPLEMKKAELVKQFGEVPKTKDGRDFELKRGRFGTFWAHPDYPEVKETIRIKVKKKEEGEE